MTPLPSTRPLAEEVKQALLASNSFLPQEEQREKHIAALCSAQAVCVAGGQQVGLFLGPLYTLYKALSIIKTAEHLSLRTHIPHVPVFWLQTEDHDVQEIDSAQVLGPDYSVQRFSARLEDKRQSVSELCWGPDIEIQIDSLCQLYPGAESLRSFYQNGRPLSQAFSLWLADLFSNRGLVFFNPRAVELKQAPQKIYQTALDQRKQIEALLLDSSFQQVRVRPGSPLFFLHLNNASGPRVRLQEKIPEQFELPGEQAITISKSELASLIQTDCRRFSASALLRPIVQDHYLPTAVFIGGEAELKYARQISPLYPLFGLKQPELKQRASFLLIEPKAARLMKKLELSPEILLETPWSEIKKQAQYPPDLSPDRLIEPLKAEYFRLLHSTAEKAIKHSPHFSQIFQQSEEPLRRVLQGLSDKYSRRWEELNTDKLRRLEELELLLAPEGKPQERFYAIVSFYFKYGRQLLELIEAEWSFDSPLTKIVNCQ